MKRSGVLNSSQHTKKSLSPLAKTITKNTINSDSFYKSIIESISDCCVFTIDKNGIITTWNSGAERLLGYPAREVIGKNKDIIFAKEEIELTIQQQMNLAKRQGKFSYQGWQQTKNKRKFWASRMVFPLKDDKNKFTGFTIIIHDQNEAREKELQLRASEAFNKSFFNSSPDCVTVLELNGDLLSMNDEGIKIMEIDDIKNHLGKFWFDLWDDQYIKEFKRAMTIARKGDIGRFRGVRPTMKGNYKWWDVCVSPVYDADGKIVQLLSVSRDITEEKFKESERINLVHELELERTKLIEIFENAPAFLSIMRGKNYVYELTNKAFHDLMGKRKVIGKPVLECFPEIKDQGFIAMLDKVYSTGVPFVGKEMKLVLHSGAKQIEKYINFVCQPTKDKMGKIDGVAANGFDITELVIAKKHAEEMSERFETMANNIPNLAWMADADGYIFWYNKRWYEYTGTTPKQMEGWGWKAVHDPEKLPEVLAGWEMSITSGQPFEMIFPLLGADKKFRSFLTRVIPVYNNHGKIIRWFGTNTDITKQIELERVKDDFLGIASHELKTPVTVIKSYTQLLEEMFTKENNVKAVGWLQKMSGQVIRLTDLINDLLDVTKIQSGKIEFENDSFDFNEMVLEIAEQIQATAPSHTIEIHLQKKREVCCDRERLGQVITNFLTNAIKYSPNANKIILNTTNGRNEVTLSIRDFGLGITKENQLKVFEQFYRVNESNRYTFPGIGLGLYISAEIIKRLKGKIWVESEEGKGSTFYFTIPTLKKNPIKKGS